MLNIMGMRFPPFMPINLTSNPYMLQTQEASNPTVLDLCLRKPTTVPNFSPDKSSTLPTYSESTRTSPESDNFSGSETTKTGNKNQDFLYPPNRPFKVYTKDPLLTSLSAQYIDKESAEAYAEFRKKMLEKLQPTTSSNTNMRRFQGSHKDDPVYLEKRKKNNEAAKRSRDARKAKEDEIAIRCAFLEQENMKLRLQLEALEKERESLQSIMFH